MTKDRIAGQGLWIMFWGAVLLALGNLRVVHPVLGGVAAIVGIALTLYGLYTAMPAHPYYKLAIIMEGVTVATAILRLIFRSGLLNSVYSIMGTLAGLIATLFICSATGELLRDKAEGEASLGEQAKVIMLLYAACAAVSVLCTLAAWVPVLDILAYVVGWASSLVMLAADVLLTIFYFRAARTLLA